GPGSAGGASGPGPSGGSGRAGASGGSGRARSSGGTGRAGTTGRRLGPAARTTGRATGRAAALAAGVTGAGRALGPAALPVAVRRERRVLGQQVVTLRIEGGVPAAVDVEALHVDARDLLDDVEPGLDEVLRQRRVAQRRSGLLTLTEEVVGETAKGVALVGV